MAAAWARSASQRNQMMGAATARMFALAGIAEGMRVLDVGTGTGDTAVLLGARVGPRGQVVATDASEAMIEAASQAIRAAGLSNVMTRVEDAGASGLEDASFDAAVARCVLMFVDDLAAGLDEVRRLLRPEGRFAAVTWAGIEKNPFHAVVIDAVRARGPLPRSTPELVLAFSPWSSDPDKLAETFRSAYFEDVVVERVASERVVDSVDDCTRAVREMGNYRSLMAHLTEADRAAAMADIGRGFARFAGEGGRCVFPMENLVVVGRRR